MATKKATAKNSRKTAKRGATTRSRKPAGGISARRKPAATQSRSRPSADHSFMGMLAEIFGMRKAAPPSRRSAR